MRGYFAIGVERISKPLNAGALIRSAHAFGASFVFAIDPEFTPEAMRAADTADSGGQVPFYIHDTIDQLSLPRGCKLVGVELTDDAIELPTFRHPLQAAYIMGAERGDLTKPVLDRCDFVVKIPTRFCINVSVAGAIVMYDRMLCHGRFAQRPVAPGGPVEARKPHVHGRPVIRTERAKA
ncbi:MAG TPA: RNA methyltransferase [Alphaproteobacteria bacterium]|nr:RNA methyltransferase [Alphaproteobacteria bacterium]